MTSRINKKLIRDYQGFLWFGFTTGFILGLMMMALFVLNK